MLNKMRVLSYIVDRVSSTLSDKDSVLPRWDNSNKTYTIPLKEIVVVKPVDKTLPYDMSSRLTRATR
jgi:hypothetical protein